MGNRDGIRIVLGSLRYKTATDTNLSIPTPLIQNSKNLYEFDRSVEVNLAQVFNDERQKSTNFRPTCKFQLLFNNSYTGSTNYEPFENNLYYINETQSAIKQCGLNLSAVTWQGFPQYDEFDFIRSDYNVSGYTTPDSTGMVHVNFVSKSASTYNWNHFVSYPYKNINKTMSYTEFTSLSPNTVTWNAIDGIPFTVLTEVSSGNELTEAGNGIIQFKCPVKHGVSVGEFVKLKIGGNDIGTYQVYSLGNGVSGMEKYVFNLFDIGYSSGFFGSLGTFKRVINNENPQDTTSKYYVIQHKIITNVEDSVLVNAGFEKNIFGTKKKFESANYTPNNTKRVSIKENSQSYTLSFNKDIDINPLRDNQKRPINELYITSIWKGYFGLTFQNGGGLKQGYDFNLPLDPVLKTPSPWWGINNTTSNFPHTTSYYTTPKGDYRKFTYLNSLKSGDTLNGDYCEWNDYEQVERVISKYYHKFVFNSDVFDISDKDSNLNQLGYYYQPHNKLKIRVFSEYIETGNINNMVDVPDYAYFSTTYNSFIWRDMYDYGFRGLNGEGVDYPFLNGTHYPYGNFVFRIIPEGTNYIESDLNYYTSLYGVAQPKNDNCE